MKSYPDVDTYIADRGRWRDEIIALRAVIRPSGLDEAIKWGKPCYSHRGANIAIIQPFKPHLALMFFKGSLLADPDALLVPQGANTHAAMRVEFTGVGEVEAKASGVRALIAEAIRAEEAGETVDFTRRKAPEPPAELVDAFDADPDLRAAWDGLTPGRQRGYLLHFNDAKKPETRVARVARAAPRILAGKGLTDR